MTANERNELFARCPVLKTVAEGKEVVWINPGRVSCDAALMETAAGMEGTGSDLTRSDIADAERRLRRFAPLIRTWFPETANRGGLIESDLVDIPAMQERLNEKYGAALTGRLLLKRDSDLPIAGSVKARGGVYEVLKRAEAVALENGLLTPADMEQADALPIEIALDASPYSVLASEEARQVFSRYTIQVGSTGNLGLSIGIMSAAIGFRVIVHMSADAREWKKELLRQKGVQVIEYQSDYSEAVRQGRAQSDEDPLSYFVDDEKSVDLFLGYAVAAGRLKEQLEEKAIPVDETHPLFVYIPCGVGGAPGGICYGLRLLFGPHVHCFFVEPTEAPCLLVGIASGQYGGICVQDIGLSGMTEADGLAVSRPSDFVSRLMASHVSGEVTVGDKKLFDYLRDIRETEGIFLEPSACAGFEGAVRLGNTPPVGMPAHMAEATHIIWATGGSLVPEEIRGHYYADKM